MLAIILGAYSFKTIARNADWKNNFTLFSEDLKNSPNSAAAHHAIANEWRIAGEKSTDSRTRTNYFYKSLEEDKKAIAIHPKFTTAYYNIGYTNLLMNKINEAETAFRKAISISPDYTDALNNLGYCFIQQNKLDSAIILCSAAAKSNSEYFRPFQNLGVAFQKKSDFVNAKIYFQKALDLAPENESIKKSIMDINELSGR